MCSLRWSAVLPGPQDIGSRLRPRGACDLLNAPATAPLTEAARGPLFTSFSIGFMHGEQWRVLVACLSRSADVNASQIIASHAATWLYVVVDAST